MAGPGAKPELGALVIGLGAPKGKPGADGEDAGDGGELMAARSLIKAVQGGDPQAVYDAFKTMLDYCQGMGMEKAEDEEEGGSTSLPFATGAPVRVRPGSEHMPEHRGKRGVVAIVKDGALGIRFDGSSEVHKWYAPDELEQV